MDEFEHLTPKEAVKELDRFVVGQEKAKKAVAIALRNRWRRLNVKGQIKEEIIPKNILMIGATGVGKTEIARRLSKLADSPFIKVEATKFTEVGYVGRDVEQIIRDLVEIAVQNAKERCRKCGADKAEKAASQRILDALVGKDASEETRAKFMSLLNDGVLDEREIEINVVEQTKSPFDFPDIGNGTHVGVFDLTEFLNKTLSSNKTKLVKMTVAEAKSVLVSEEKEKLVDNDKIVKDAITSVEQHGIVFIDEIDKVCSRNTVAQDVSREGVQRDLLPIIEGCAVSTKYGVVHTNHILFIASGAFQVSKPSDLLPELQGRLPIRVELDALSHDDFVRILKCTENSLILQYKALMETENLELVFTDDGINKIAEIAHFVNQNIENIGARRLHTILEKLLEEVSFEAALDKRKTVTVDADYVSARVSDLAQKTDLSRFIL